MQLAHLHGVLLAHTAPAIDQQPQDLDLFVGHNWPESGHADRDQGDRVGVSVVSLATLPGGVEPQPGRHLRRHVHHRLTISDQALHDVPTDPLTALHRPRPLRPLPAVTQHRLVALSVSGEPPPTDHQLIGGHHFDGGGPLVRIHPDHHPWHVLTHRTPSRGSAVQIRVTRTMRGQPQRERPPRPPKPSLGQDPV